MNWLLIATLVLSVIHEGRCNYTCACVYSAEKSVYQMNSTVSTVIGMMFEFDCKPLANVVHDEHWITIQYEHKLGYLESDKDTEIRSCTGDAPYIDKWPLPMSEVPTTKSPTTPAPPTTMTMTGSSFVHGHIELCPPRIQQLAAQQSSVTLGQFGHSCYEIVQGGLSWEHAESTCIKNGGHLAHISNQQEQDFIHNFLVKHRSHVVWIGLHDQNTEEHFTWSAGGAVNYTNWAPLRYTSSHDSEDCVYMLPDTGLWNDVECGVNLPVLELLGSTHGYICQFDTIDRTQDGDISLCPSSARVHVATSGGVLAQNGNSCYELNKHLATWSDAESTCRANGGQLVQINDATEQAFIQGFMQRHSPLNAAWIGLTDSASEGTFQWLSGQSLTYANWVSGHVANHASSDTEDCVILSPFDQGQWDDIPCGHTGGFLLGIVLGKTYTHQSICQYGIQQANVIIG